MEIIIEANDGPNIILDIKMELQMFLLAESAGCKTFFSYLLLMKIDYAVMTVDILIFFAISGEQYQFTLVGYKSDYSQVKFLSNKLKYVNKSTHAKYTDAYAWVICRW